MSAHSDIEAISATAARWVARRDAGLSGAEQAEFARWLDADPRHAAAFEHYARAWSAFDGPGRAGAQVAMIDRIKTRVRRRRLRQAGGVLTAAAACAIVALGFASLRDRPGADAGGARPADSPASSVAVLQPERRALEDGSTVELRQGAVIDVRYDAATRRVILMSGEAHFQVAKGQPRPFVVMAGATAARAVGTEFTVQRDEERVEVLVTEGHVAVEKTSPENAAAPALVGGSGAAASETIAPPVTTLATLGAREHIIVKTAPANANASAPDAPDASEDAPPPAVETLTPAEVNARLEWRVPVIEFSATPLAEAVAQFNRYSRMPDGSENARLVLAPDLSGLATEPVSGLFRANNIEAFVHLLGVNMNIASERRGAEIILRKTEE